jgi:outer membrane lipoprotein-sorting protein
MTNKKPIAAPSTSLTRRSALGGFGLFLAAGLAGGTGLGALTGEAAAQASAAPQRIADHFSSIKTMTGDFIQFGPRGEQSEGKFFIERPGKLRFNFNDPSPMRVIADGQTVVIGNQKLKTWDMYPLSKTPLKLLLDDRIDLTGPMVRSVNEAADLTTIVLGDKSLFGDSTITMMFDPNTYDLRQWTMTDAQGRDTTVMIMNVQTGVQFAANVFEVPYAEARSRGLNTAN